MSQVRLSVSQRTTGEGVHVVALAGTIDHTTAGAFRQALTLPADSAPHAVVDFHDVTFMDSSGINVLVAANNTARARGGSLRLAAAPARVLELLRIVGLDALLPLHPTLEEALAPTSAA
ncbi:STAS domain-containing protein [Streptomyces sp. NPDC052676]|uniref:STAS domain-containing protein n=1 Tax=Streptomyces sp. NPDC052676 TaxID=3154953 RepID=UPI0034142AF5